MALMWTLIILGVVAAIIFMVVIWPFFKIWMQASSAGADISMANLIGMKMRKVDIRVIVSAKIAMVQAGLDITTQQLESHYLSNGHVSRVATAMIAAHRASIDLPWQQAAAIDLAGRDVLDAVQTSVNPRVIDVPNANSGRQTHDGVAKDGIQLRVKARVTVRTNIHQLTGGAGEETIVARVGEGIVAAIGSADSYKHVLQQPDMISKMVLSKGLDAGTAFQILSIDIADMDVSDNVGAKLQIASADAAKQLAQAEAEKRRALAVALEQENKALAQFNRAKLIEAEAQIPLAMAEAFRNGNLGVVDYFRMKNIQADTKMRESIAGGDTSGSPSSTS
jgi:uncharacterized protein YqfA (UPF0365 family)